MTQQNSPPPPDLSKWLVVLMIAGGGISGGVLGLIGQLEPGYIILLVILGLLVGRWLTFVLRVGDDVLRRHEKRAADLLNIAVQDFFTLQKPHEQPYKRYLLRRYGTYNMAINLENAPALQLQDVFVEPQINQDAPSMNPVPATKLNAGNTATIWTYLNTMENLALVGAPGSGKTTLLEHITLILAGKARARKAVNAPKKIPVLIKLRDHTKCFEALDTLTLPDLVLDGLKFMKPDERPPLLWFERQLKSGKCIVMFDGVDELGQGNRELVVRWIDQQMNVQYPECVFVITSRPAGFSNSKLKSKAVFNLLPLAHTQVQAFIHNWYLQTELRRNQGQKDRAVAEMRAEEGKLKLLAVLEQRPAIAELTVNPLLLTMIVSLHYYKRANLPERRAELYREICKLFLGELDEQKGIPVLVSADQKQTVLEPLAYAMLCGVGDAPKLAMSKDAVLSHIAMPLALLPNITGETFLEQFKTRTPLLVEREADEYEFAHKTFAEYLTAVHIKEQALEAELLQRLDDDNWHEVIRLYCALPKVNATSIIAACIEQVPLSTERLVLAVQCEQDAQVEPGIRARLRAIVDESLDSDDPERRAVGTSVVLRRRLLEGFRRIDDRTQIDTTLITHGEYRLFFEELQKQGHYFYPDHWNLQTFVHPIAKTPILGAGPLDARAFSNWLTARDPVWRYRLPRVGEGSGIPFPYWLEIEQSAVYIQGGELRPVVGVNARLILLTLVYSDISDRDLERDIDLTLARASDLASDLARASDHVSYLAHALALASAFALARDLANDLTSGSDLANDLARARDLANDLINDFVRDRANDLTSASAHAHARAGERDFAFASDLALDRAHASARDLLRLDKMDRREAFIEMWGIGVLLSAIVEREYADFHDEHTQWLKDAVSDLPGGWHQYLDALRIAVTQASKKLHQQVDNVNIVEQLRKRGEYQTLRQEMVEIDALRLQLDTWEARRNGAQEPVEGLLLVRERKI